MSEFYYKRFIQSVDRYDPSSPSRMNISSLDNPSPLSKNKEPVIYYKGKNIPQKALMLAKIQLLLLDEIDSDGEPCIAHLVPAEKEFYHILKKLSKNLYTLACIDKSNDGEFLKQLSKNWSIFSISANRRIQKKKQESYTDLLKDLYTSIDELSIDNSLTFGYYLQKSATQDWFPVPYLKILQYVYLDHKKNKQQSIAAHWICDISEILTILLSKHP